MPKSERFQWTIRASVFYEANQGNRSSQFLRHFEYFMYVRNSKIRIDSVGSACTNGIDYVMQMYFTKSSIALSV